MQDDDIRDYFSFSNIVPTTNEPNSLQNSPDLETIVQDGSLSLIIVCQSNCEPSGFALCLPLTLLGVFKKWHLLFEDLLLQHVEPIL
jgi:hypothetical protein